MACIFQGRDVQSASLPSAMQLDPQQQQKQLEDLSMMLELQVNPTDVTQPKWHFLLGKFCWLL